MKSKLILLLSFIVVLSLAIIAGASLLHKGLLPTHDGEYHVVRFYQFDKMLRDGNLYPRWAADLNNGYGVPLFNFVYPLPNYVASLLHVLGFSFIDSFKLNMFFALILGSIFFYLWAKEFWGHWGGVVGAIFYTYSPYHFLDIYIRGSVGEVWALAFFPAFLWAVTWYIRSRKQHLLPISSVFLALIIFSHNILALMFFPFALFYYAFLLLGDKRKKGDWGEWGKGIFVFLLGIGLSATFWLPALFERQYVTGLEIFDISRHFPELYQLVIPSWGSGFSGESFLQNGLSFQIGIANLLGVFFALLICFMNKNKNRKIILSILFFTIWFIIFFFLMLKISLPIWQAVPFMNYFQFPWRFLSLEILIASFLSGSIVYFWKSKLVAVFLILFSVALGIGYAKPAHYLYRDDNYYITRSNFIDGTNSPGNVFNTIWFNQNLKRQSERIIIDKGKLKSSVIKPTSHTYFVSIVSESNVKVNIAYFPGWHVFIDKKRTITRPDSNGLISFIAPKGEHLIEVKFQDTLVRTVANFVFFGSLFSILFCIMRWYNIARLLKKYGKS